MKLYLITGMYSDGTYVLAYSAEEAARKFPAAHGEIFTIRNLGKVIT